MTPPVTAFPSTPRLRTALSGTSFALFDDSLAPPDEVRSLLLFDLAETLVCHSPDEVDAILKRIDAAAADGFHVAVVADYELGYWLEPKAARTLPSGAGPLLCGYVYRQSQALDGHGVAALLAAHVAALPEERRLAGIAGLQPGIGESDYLAAIERILGYIADGDCYQVDYTFPLRFRHYGDPLALYAQLRAAQPVHHGAFLQAPGRSLLSLSPELFVERHGDRLTTRPMKGTARRQADPQADAACREALAASEKNRAENLMIVDLIRNDLGRIACIGSVKVERLFEVEPYPTVWQMTSTISADVPDASLATVFRALFPCGSVTGAPKIRAMQIAADLEPATRGVYTGAIGHVSPGGDFRFNVPIRTLCLDHDGAGSLGIGSGIVADSAPADELAECHAKARFATGLAAGFELIETLLCTPAEVAPFPLLETHLERLSTSARYFGFRCDLEALRHRLQALARTLVAATPHRVRLLLDKSGDTTLAAYPLVDDGGPVNLVLATRRVDSRNIFRYHKTTVRHEYDAELAALAATPGVFDALFCNERGELCEGARTNIVLRLDGRLYTPPVSAGLLDGVMRRTLLADTALGIVERTLYPEDLQRAEELYVCNALRGLRPARLLDVAAAPAVPHLASA